MKGWDAKYFERKREYESFRKRCFCMMIFWATLIILLLILSFIKSTQEIVNDSSDFRFLCVILFLIANHNYYDYAFREKELDEVHNRLNELEQKIHDLKPTDKTDGESSESE